MKYLTVACVNNSPLLVAAIYQIDNHLNNGILLFRFALRNQQRQGDQGIVGQAFAAITTVEDIVGVEKVDENGSGNPFVAITKCMIFDDKVK